MNERSPEAAGRVVLIPLPKQLPWCPHCEKVLRNQIAEALTTDDKGQTDA